LGRESESISENEKQNDTNTWKKKYTPQICSKLVVLEEFPLKIMLFVRPREKSAAMYTKHKHKIQAALSS
jgi:hypothetical protein